jgi:hypothetical protein
MPLAVVAADSAAGRTFPLKSAQVSLIFSLQATPSSISCAKPKKPKRKTHPMKIILSN